MKFAYCDGEKLCVYQDGETKEYTSEYVTRYRDTAKRSAKNAEWKEQGKAARLAEEEYYFLSEDRERVIVNFYGATTTGEDDRIVYAVSCNESAAVYNKQLSDEKKTEGHIVSASDADFTSLCVSESGELLASVQSDPVASDIAVFERGRGDYKRVTGGDSLDENPFLCPNGKSVLFNSYGVGRDANNNFVSYVPSAIYKLDLQSLEVDELRSNDKYSYVKPTTDGRALYCIRKPGSEKTGANPIVEILTIPVRIVQAIAGFISSFVMCFAGKPLVSGQSGRDAVKGGGDQKKAFINNNLINVDKELKRNKKRTDYGFIPQSWKLVKITPSGEEELACGVADYTLAGGGLVYTNGKHIFSLVGEKREKLVDTDFCVKVGAAVKTEETDGGLFDLI